VPIVKKTVAFKLMRNEQKGIVDKLINKASYATYLPQKKAFTF